jgi:acyl-CoA thioesterase
VEIVGKTSAFLAHLGMEIVDLQPGRSLIRLPLQPHLKNSSGGMHGGAIASLIDSAGGLAARTLTHPMTVTTVEFKVNFLAPIRHGKVSAEGRVVHRGRRLAVSEVEVRDEADRPVARGLVTLMILTQDGSAPPPREGRRSGT